MSLMKKFKMPTQVTIAGRTSSMTNAFINGIIPCIQPTEEELKQCFRILELDENDLRCAYCDNLSTEWDHLRPIVENKKPTGYISNIYNLVPSCGKCNQSKGNRDWKEWIGSDAPQSPKSRNIKNLDKRIKRLEKYEKWGNKKPINFKNMVSKGLWQTHWENYEKLCEMIQDCQIHANKLKKEISSNLENAKK